MGLRPLYFRLFFQCGDRFWTSDSDVYGRQMLKLKVDPRNERADLYSKRFRFILIQIRNVKPVIQLTFKL